MTRRARAAATLLVLGTLCLGAGGSGRDSSVTASSRDSLVAASGRDTVDLTPYLAARASRQAKVPWRIGEYFQFSIDWSGLNGGNALMQVQNMQTVDGRRTWRIITKAESNSFVSKFYKVRDRAETYVDAESLFARRFEKHLREGSYKKDLSVRFDQGARKAIYDNGKSFDVPARVHDVLSAFYYIRTQPLPDGGSVSIPTHDNEKSYDMVVKVLRRERVEVPAGKFDCVVVEPVLKSEGIFKAKGQMFVWLSDDERRIPVQVKSKVPIGSISVSLTDMRLAFQGKP
jgi:uncharacterized protein DUF3108